MTPTVDRLYGAGVNGNLMQEEFLRHPRVRKALQRRHKQVHLIDENNSYHGWPVPYGVRYALTKSLHNSQLVSKYPWYVTWCSPNDGRRKKKYFMSLIGAIHFAATKASRVDPHASIVSRTGIDIPPSLRGKLPKPWKWCPCCMAPRKYKRVHNSRGYPVTFERLVKAPIAFDRHGNVTKYEFTARVLALMRCQVCGLTNQNHKFRRSNQPWEKRKVKKGARRVKRRHRTPQDIANRIHWRRADDIQAL